MVLFLLQGQDIAVPILLNNDERVSESDIMVVLLNWNP